ncbi:MAG: radical SAM protein, partial [Oligoflexia bacterium]|nr:radical SAM protein [Oligoflexia bacterium]
CNSYCSYCIIPYVRGRESSRSIDDVVREVTELEKNGIKEVVISGINLGSYRYGVENLLETLLEKTGKCRFRLSSLRPSGITNDIIKLLKNTRVCPHLHISLQSGSDRILKLMNRHDYSGDDFVRITEKINHGLSGRMPFIAADVIAGFPGESDADFNETVKVLGSSRINRLHVFAFSPRPGTRAFDMRLCDSSTVNRRKKVLLEFSDRVYSGSVRNMNGRDVEVLWEADGRGITENYFEAITDGTFKPAINTVSRCRVTGINYEKMQIVCSLIN